MTLVLCLPSGAMLGALPRFDVALPYWQETADVVAMARAVHGVDVVLLRLLSTDTERPDLGGSVCYLAQVHEAPRVSLEPWPDPSAGQDHPLRQRYARPGGPEADLSWADEVLDGRGTPRCAPAEQMRSWNLSSLWRLPTARGTCWLKSVPPFFAHEGQMLARLDPSVVPSLIAEDGPRVLLDELPGVDQYGARLPQLLRMVPLLVGLQVEWSGRIQELLSIGLPDWRPTALTALAADTLARSATDLDVPTARRLESLIATLPDRFAQINACGITDSLVHSDFHPGNVRGTETDLRILDWGDCGVGHPLLDRAAFVERLTAGDRAAVESCWSGLWRAAVHGCSPERAAELLEPVSALQKATVYRMFLDQIEPTERVYHATDPVLWLRRAAASGRGRSTGS